MKSVFRTVRRVLPFVVVGCLATWGCTKPSADELFAKGNEHFDKGRLPEAVVQYRSAVQLEPKRGDIRAKLADAYMRQQDRGSALREAVLAADLLPNDATAQVKAGSLLLLAGQFEDARSRAEKALAIEPANTDGLILRGNALAGLKDMDGALTEFREVVALDPAGEQAYRNIGVIQMARGQVQEAEATFRKAIAASPKSVSARSALASFLWASRRTSEAEQVFKEALSLDPANLSSNRALGFFFMSTGRPALAEPYFKTFAETVNSDPARLALADYYLGLGRLDDARAIVTPLTQKTESFEAASVRLAAIETLVNNRPAARALISRVLEKNPKHVPARVFEIRLQLKDNELDEALANATRLAKDEPNSAAAAEAAFIIGSIEASRDRMIEAEEAYREALRLQPQSAPVAMAMAVLQLRIGQPAKAEQFARQVLTLVPGNAAARAVIVRSLLMRNELKKAVADLAGLEREYPNAPPVQNLVASRELTAGRLDAARAVYQRVLTQAPNDLEALQGLVGIDLQTGRTREATDRIDSALKRRPSNADLYVLAARAHGAAGNNARAEEMLKAALELDPARLSAYSLLGQLYVSQRRLDDARTQFEALLKRNPRSVPVNTMLGMLLEMQGNAAAAETQYRKTLGVESTAAVAANNLAWILAVSNRSLDEALQLGQTALKALPDEPHFNDTVGWVLYRKGSFTLAVRHLEVSVRRPIPSPSAYYRLGMAYVQVGDIEKGKTALRKALSLSATFDGSDEARKTLAALERGTAA